MMSSCCAIKCYGDVFEFHFFSFILSYLFEKNGTAMAVLAAPLPAALIQYNQPAGTLVKSLHFFHNKHTYLLLVYFYSEVHKSGFCEKHVHIICLQLVDLLVRDR